MIRKLAPVLVAVALAGAYLGYRWYISHQPYQWSGTVEVRTINVGSRAGGRVKEVLVREGERVAAGQPLVTLEVGDLEAQRLMAEGQLGQAEANLEKLQHGARPEEIEQARARSAEANAALLEARTGTRSEQIAAAQERLAATQASLDKAQMDSARAHKLLTAGATSQAEVDSADSALKSAAAQRNALKKTLDELQNGVRAEQQKQAAARAVEARASATLVEAGARPEDIKAAKAAVAAAQGKADSVKVLLDELTIRAPKAARIEALDLRPGDLLTPSAPAATLLEEDQLYLRIYVPETQLGHIRVGQEVPVTVDSFPGRSFKGVVEHINNVGEYSPRNLQTADERADQVFAARIGLAEGREELRAGMAAFVTVPKK